MKHLLLAAAALSTGILSANSYAVSCVGVPSWNSTTEYYGGSQAQLNGNLYKANWWSQNHSPATNSGQWQEWTLVGACDSVASSSKSSAVSSISSVISSSKSSAISSSVVSIASSSSSKVSSSAVSVASSSSSAPAGQHRVLARRGRSHHRPDHCRGARGGKFFSDLDSGRTGRF